MIRTLCVFLLLVSGAVADESARRAIREVRNGRPDPETCTDEDCAAYMRRYVAALDAAYGDEKKTYHAPPRWLTLRVDLGKIDPPRSLIGSRLQWRLAGRMARDELIELLRRLPELGRHEANSLLARISFDADPSMMEPLAATGRARTGDETRLLDAYALWASKYLGRMRDRASATPLAISVLHCVELRLRGGEQVHWRTVERALSVVHRVLPPDKAKGESRRSWDAIYEAMGVVIARATEPGAAYRAELGPLRALRSAPGPGSVEVFLAVLQYRREFCSNIAERRGSGKAMAYSLIASGVVRHGSPDDMRRLMEGLEDIAMSEEVADEKVAEVVRDACLRIAKLPDERAREETRAAARRVGTSLGPGRTAWAARLKEIHAHPPDAARATEEECRAYLERYIRAVDAAGSHSFAPSQAVCYRVDFATLQPPRAIGKPDLAWRLRGRMSREALTHLLKGLEERNERDALRILARVARDGDPAMLEVLASPQVAMPPQMRLKWRFGRYLVQYLERSEVYREKARAEPTSRVIEKALAAVLDDLDEAKRPRTDRDWRRAAGVVNRFADLPVSGKATAAERELWTRLAREIEHELVQSMAAEAPYKARIAPVRMVYRYGRAESVPLLLRLMERRSVFFTRIARERSNEWAQTVQAVGDTVARFGTREQVDALVPLLEAVAEEDAADWPRVRQSLADVTRRLSELPANRISSGRRKRAANLSKRTR
ncbi:MAG: hypothetical protein AAGD14_02475 [Planctomycetota bacterium]